MAYTDHIAPTYLPPDVTTPGVAALQRAMLWFVGVGGAIVMIEPSPYELATLSALIVFFATGLRMRPLFLPLLFLLIAINLGYTIASIYLLNDATIINWIATSWYMAVTAIFFAMVFADDTKLRMDSLARGYVVGALIASIAGIAGYFSLIPGGFDLFTAYGRAKGTFKDPNVLGAFLILPALFALQSILLDRFSKAARSSIFLGIIGIAVLLSFSRAAWGQLVATSAFVIAITFYVNKQPAQRTRIVLLTGLAIAGAVLFIALLLSLDSVGNLFKERASFDQSYDGGRFGRFGRYILGAEMALDFPLGIGPMQFKQFMPEDAHNSYLNAFMSGGWIAGVTFPALIFTTVFFGFRYLLIPTPWHRAYIAVFAAFLGTVAESFIIDIDHWRHFFLLLGTMWAMFAATQIEMRRQVSSKPFNENV